MKTQRRLRDELEHYEDWLNKYPKSNVEDIFIGLRQAVLRELLALQVKEHSYE